MARKGRKAENKKGEVGDYRHEEAKRKNNPEVGLADLEPKAKTPPKVKYEYDPFLDPQLPLDQAVEFYRHNVDWANRLILGDSLLVINSLLQRELMAGRVQMIYMGPPYGVAYNSNFQPSIRQRDVKDGQDDSLTHEPEQIKAYRDTWTLGTHSYLTHLRDRLLLCRELLAETGLIFVQISDENILFVRCILDEVFGKENSIAVMPFRKKTMPLATKYLEQMDGFVLWYAKSKDNCKYRSLYRQMTGEGDWHYRWAEMQGGSIVRPSRDQVRNHALLPPGARLFMLKSLEPSGPMASGMFDFRFQGETFRHPRNGCCTTFDGMKRLEAAARLAIDGDRPNHKLYVEDRGVTPFTIPWQDTNGPRDKLFVVQTSHEVLQHCMLTTTDPGDFVFNPTCGSGTTAYVAEQSGRRWITCDASRAALARQRPLTATFDYYQLAHPEQGVDADFVYETVPHITLKSIAQNSKTDEVADDDPKRPEKIAGKIIDHRGNEMLEVSKLEETEAS